MQFSMRSKGHYTKAIAGLKAGDKVKVRGPFGGFVLDSSHEPEVVLIAGGIGITPFMSMIRYAAAASLSNKVTLMFSCQNQDDIPFKHEIVELERQNPHFQAVFIIGDGPTGSLHGQKIAKGRITPEIVKDVLPSFANKTFFVCGPPPFMKAVIKQLEGMGIPKSVIMTEAFSQGPNRQTGKMKSWPFNVYVLGALGVVLGSFAVMVSDLLKTLPPSSIFGDSGTIRKETLTNSRQTDLDALVNKLPELPNNNPPTNAVSKALAATQKTPSQTTNTQQSSGTPSNTSTTTPTTKTRQPVCTTSQSGVTTCI